ncbi:hypothetical protein SHLO109777_11670 [Shewanella loihica]|uniref:Uncharacterized protein n=1 Tax=Shewanella loihica (strain ATCC BAA-1088 / PV-4) TaxID=323850 RepID=A3QCC8_SHELP|nr:hypothetical protein [Shewanella loihica]ABO23126.1 conserved hypothetical protein [Shewanella loihica PV-4]
MIEFTDSFSQASVAEACTAFPELLKRLSLELTLPTFERPLDNNGHIIGPAAIEPPKALRKTVLYVCQRDMLGHLPKEIGFCRYQRQCDQYGTPEGEWQKILNGIYYNHGNNDHPSWSCHT